MDWARAGRIAAVTALTAGIATGYWWGPLLLRRMSFFTVRRVEVHGTRYLAPREVVRRMGMTPQSNIFDDLGRYERGVLGQGGIREASVRRRLPGTLVVQVSEVEPVALAQGPDGLIPLGSDGGPLPYDLQTAPVDVPVIRDADRPLVEALAGVQAADINLFGEVAAAHRGPGEVVLDLSHGRVRLGMPVDAETVRKVAVVKDRLAEQGGDWTELDARFRGWIVVRRAQPAAATAVARSPSRQARRTVARRPTARRSR